MIDTEGKPLKCLVFTPVEGENEVHLLPNNFDAESMHSMASDILGTESSEQHDLGTDSLGVMRVIIYTLIQDGSKPLNTQVIDGMVLGFDTLVAFEGDCVVGIVPNFEVVSA